MTPLAAVLGDPIGHSRSPRLQGHWLARYGIAGHYIPLHVRAEDLATILALMPRLGFVGCNVTLPHKSDVLALATQATALARRIGSANTLTFIPDGGFEADNTDAHGFTWNILDSVPDWRPRRAAIVGAGGASRAVIVALQDRGASEIRITNRSPQRVEQLAAEFSLTAVPWADRAKMLEGCDFLVNGTTQGMHGQPPLDLPLDALPNTAIVSDLVYTPLETPLLRKARARGNPVVDGLGMLLHQAAPGFARWFGHMPTVDADLRKAVMG